MLLFALIACNPAPAPAPVADPVVAPAAAPAAAAAPAGGTISGVVAETIPAGEYTYTRVHAADGTDSWAAAPGTAPAVGATVSFSTAMPMTKFHSDTLSRDFALVYFVPSIDDGSAPAANAAPAGMPAAMMPASDTPAAALPASTGPDTQTIAAIVADRKKLAGQKVTVSGNVVKSTKGVLGHNWLHIQTGTDDLTVTTNDTAAVGQHVQVTGTVAVDQDYGAGYTYPVIITDAVLAGL